MMLFTPKNKYTFNVLVLILGFSGFNSISSQGDSKFVTNNQDVHNILKLVEDGNEEEAQILYLKSLEELKAEKNWKEFIALSYKYLRFKRANNQYENPINVVSKSIEFLKKNQPDQYLNCDEVIRSIGYLYRQIHEKEKSLEAYKSYFDIIYQKFPQECCIENALANNTLGVAYRFASIYDKPQAYFEKAISILEGLEQTNAVLKELAKSHEHLGHFHSVYGQTENALLTTKKGYDYAIKAVGENDLFLIPFLMNIAGFYGDLGESDLHFEFIKKGTYIVEASGTKDSYFFEYLLPGLYLGMASGHLYNQQPKMALEYYNKALAIVKNYKADWLTENNIYAGIANVYTNNGETNKALLYYLKADSTLNAATEKVKEDNHYKILQASLKLSLASIYSEINEFEKAKSNVLLSEKISAHFGKDHNGIKPSIYSNLSNVFYLENKLDSALYYNQIALYASAGDCTSSDTIYMPEVDKFKSTTQTYNIINQRISVLKQIAGSKKEKYLKNKYLSEALIFLELIDTIHFNNLKKVSTLRSSNSKSLIEASILCYKNGLDAIYNLNEENPSPRYFEKAFEVIQKAKAQSLLLSRTNENASSIANLPEEVIQKERNLNLEIVDLEKQAIDAQKAMDTIGLQFIENELLFTKRKELAAFKKEIESKYPEYHTKKYSFSSYSIADLKNILTPEEVIIDYTLVSDSTFFTFSFSKNNDPVFVKTKSQVALSKAIKNYFKFIQKTSLQRQKNLNSFVEQSHLLYNIFIEPIQNQLIGKKRIIVFGDNLSYYIPFETLVEKSNPVAYNEMPYLIKRYDISYHYSSSIFYNSRQQKDKFSNSIFAFAPVYDMDQNNEVTYVDNLRIDTTLRAFNPDGSYLPLYESENEVVTISNMFDNTSTSTLLLRTEANESQLKINLQKKYKYIHIAGHSFANLKHPKFSGIACIQQSSTEKEDGILYLGELSNMSINTDLITLSSCESGFGQLDYSEGLLGINRKFIQAGANNVVFSLWKVMDGVSANLMIDFYKNIYDNNDYASSLRKSKLQLISKNETATPNLWSAFLLIGR